MKLVAVSQRVDVVMSYQESRDALDQAWATGLEQLGILTVPVPNTLADPAAWFAAVGAEGLILTGGNDLSAHPNALAPAPERDRTESALLSAAFDVPVLAICRGFQMMNQYLGGQTRYGTGHVGNAHDLVRVADDATLGAPRQVNSFHNWVIESDDLASALIPIHAAPDMTIEAARHRSLQWIGIMWHPERPQAFGTADRHLFQTHFRLDKT